MKKIKLKDLWDKFIKKQKKRQREFDRDLDFLDTDFFHFLKLIFVKDDIDKKTLMKKRRLNKEKFNLLENMAISKQYIYSLLVSEEKGGATYRIKDDGIDFLLNFKRIQKEEKHSNVIKWATIVLAIAAFVQAADIWVNKPGTRDAIIKWIGEAIGALFTLIKELIPIALGILGIYILYKIYRFFKEKD